MQKRGKQVELQLSHFDAVPRVAVLRRRLRVKRNTKKEAALRRRYI
jgi:hypothetical protein